MKYINRSVSVCKIHSDCLLWTGVLPNGTANVTHNGGASSLTLALASREVPMFVRGGSL